MVAMQETVVLVHGVLMTGKVMAVLARRLKGCGYRPVIYDYPTRRRSMLDNARSLAQFVENLGTGRVHLVGHSMGGVLILRALQVNPGLPPGRVVVMGAPVRGSAVAKRLCCYGPGRWLLGASAEEGLLEAVPDCSYGREIGTVGVAETCLPGATDTLVINASHTSLVLSHKVARQVCSFLRQGRFSMPASAT